MRFYPLLKVISIKYVKKTKKINNHVTFAKIYIIILSLDINKN